MSGAGSADRQMPDVKEWMKGTQMCKFHAMGKCNRGSNCNFAHSFTKLRAKPNFAKTRLCPTILAGKRCFNLATCSYAHSKEEMRVAAQQRSASEKSTKKSTKKWAQHYSSVLPLQDDHGKVGYYLNDFADLKVQTDIYETDLSDFLSHDTFDLTTKLDVDQMHLSDTRQSRTGQCLNSSGKFLEPDSVPEDQHSFAYDLQKYSDPILAELESTTATLSCALERPDSKYTSFALQSQLEPTSMGRHSTNKMLMVAGVDYVVERISL